MYLPNSPHSGRHQMGKISCKNGGTSLAGNLMSLGKISQRWGGRLSSQRLRRPENETAVIDLQCCKSDVSLWWHLYSRGISSRTRMKHTTRQVHSQQRKSSSMNTSSYRRRNAIATQKNYKFKYYCPTFSFPSHTTSHPVLRPEAYEVES